MATYTVTDPQTNQKVTLTSADNKPPTEGELNQIFSTLNPSSSMENAIGKMYSSQQDQQIDRAPKKSLSTSETVNKVESGIAARPTAFGANAQYDFSGHPVISTLKAASAPFQLAEAVPADVLLAAQRANQGGFNKLGENLSQDIQGNRVPQIGDVYRGSMVPGLNSEPVAATLGLTAAMGAPGISAGTKAVGKAYEAALSPATSAISAAAQKFGKPLVANTLSMVTTKPSHIWENLIDNPEFADKKFVTMMNDNAANSVRKTVNPLQENPTNRVLIDETAKSQLHDLGMIVKPEGVDNSTLTAAIRGDENAIAKVSGTQSIEDLQKIMADPNTSMAERKQVLRKITDFASSNKPGEANFEQSAAMQSLSKSQRNKLMEWYQKVIKNDDISFNQARGIVGDIDNTIKNYWDKVEAKGQGINGTQAGQFERLATGIRKVVSDSIETQYPEAGKALSEYSSAKKALGVYKATSTIEPHMFRAFFMRMGLGMAGAGPMAYPAAAMSSIPAVNAKMIQAGSKIGGLAKANPALLAPLLRAMSVSSSKRPSR